MAAFEKNWAHVITLTISWDACVKLIPTYSSLMPMQHLLIPGNRECYHPWQRGIKAADGIKLANQLI